MKRQEGVVQRDTLAFDKAYALSKVLKRPTLKKLKWCDKVVLKFSKDGYYEGYVTALNGGDMGNTIEQSMFGDQVQLFMVPKRGYKFMQGLKTFWLCDIGIGKTRAEADATYMQHDWFKRSKQQIQNDRFWSSDMEELRNKDEYND